jgi:hypothetical protein
VAKDHQVAPLGTLLTAAPIVEGGFFDTGSNDSTGASVNFNRQITGLSAETPYKWRMRFRVADPIFPHTRWITMPGNGREIFDLRTSCPSATYYRDVDGDGFGNNAVSQVACVQPAGYVAAGGDCNDNDPAMFPGNPEVCDGKDNDCNGTADNGFPAPGTLTSLSALDNVGNLARFRWGAVTGADRYDVLRGDLAKLHSSAGDFAFSSQACVANDGTVTNFAETDPGPTPGMWYLVRAVNCASAGSYDEPGGRQVQSRDAEIAASGVACP